MVVSIVLCAAALRAGLSLRRARRFRTRRKPNARAAHLRLAKPAVAAVVIGFVAGPVSALTLRGWDPFQTFHSFVGIATAALFIATAVLGRRLERGTTRSFDAHALLGMLAMLAAMIAAVAGFVLMP